MVEEIFAKAFITRMANGLYDLLLGKKNFTQEKEAATQDEEKIKLLIEQKLSEEVKTLEQSNDEIKLLDAIRNSFVHRIHTIFQLFDIRLEEVPIFLNKFGITNKDVLYEEYLIESFDNQVIDFISDSLEINKDWIYGRTREMIPSQSYGYYKNSTFFCNEIIASSPSGVYILTQSVPNKKADEENDGNYIYIVVQYSKLVVNNRRIYTYKIYNESCRYSYWRCRYELKRFILGFRKAYQDNLLYGKVIPNLTNKMHGFAEGKTDFDDLLKNSQMWYPTDYIELPKDSACAIKDEVDELQQILDEYDKINSY